MDRKKTIHEDFARFFETPSRDSLRVFLKDHMGELRNCDFKESWPEHAPVAKHLLGLANVGGGCLIIGVKENDDKTLSPVGIAQLKDKIDIINGVKHFLPEPLLGALEIGDFPYDAAEYPTLVGKRFQVAFVHARPEAVPFVAQRSGEGVRACAIYIRREGGTEEATYEEVQRLIKQRLAASPQTAQARDLKEHLEELKVLYGEIPEDFEVGSPLVRGMFEGIANSIRASGLSGMFAGEWEPNPDYPTEDYQSFVRRLLDAKKKLIENLLGLPK
jgi:hypothetical protein